jgi:HD superfamily phosphodiesterase
MEKGKNFHDFAHVMNVYRNVEKLLEHEKGNRLVLLSAALFHDIERDVIDHDEVGAKRAEEILLTVPDFPEDLIDSVVDIIDSHSKSKGLKTAEQILFYDADKMDAFSELGIIRSFMMYAQEGKSTQEACLDYLELVDFFYNRLQTDLAKKLVEEKYKKARQFALNLVEEYNY